jgi:hypothetical protein
MQLVVAATNQEKCQQNKNAKNRQTGTILILTKLAAQLYLV